MPKREKHPALYPRRKHCKWINEINFTNIRVYRVSYRSDYDNLDKTIYCKTLTKISSCENNLIEFWFEEYFTEKEQAELQKAFLKNEYDDLGDLPEF
jgi:hypothetical protein